MRDYLVIKYHGLAQQLLLCIRVVAVGILTILHQAAAASVVSCLYTSLELLLVFRYERRRRCRISIEEPLLNVSTGCWVAQHEVVVVAVNYYVLNDHRLLLLVLVTLIL